ncbi:MAG: ISKra4 family transposase [Chloroflexota bacterium]
MFEALPASIVAQLETLGQALAEVAQAQRDETLATVEAATLGAIRTAMPGLLTAVLRESTSSLRPGAVGRRVACRGCAERCRVQSWRERTVTTVCGTITLERPWYHCRKCRHGWSPIDATWALAVGDRISAGLADWLIDLGASTSFVDAQRELGKLTGLTVAAETIRRDTERRGAELEAADRTAARVVDATREAAERGEPTPGDLVVETDGVMVRYHDGGHEVKLGVVGGQVDGELAALSYVGAREAPESFGPRLLTEAARRGALDVVGWEGPRQSLAILRSVVVLGDGAPWIWNLAAEHFGERVEIVDFYHAAEHVWTIAHALFGEGTYLATRWAHFTAIALAYEGAAGVLPLLDATRAATSTATAILQRERQYFRTHAARMDYPTFRARGLPLGSGAVESAGKHLVQMRMKRAGTRWSDDGASGVLAVRCRLVSNRPLAA